MTAITIGSNITSIGNSAFQGCNLLNSIILPTNSMSIAVNSNAFTAIAQVVSVNGSAGNTPIPSNMFNGNTNMTAITIGSNITSIGASAFQGCSLLNSITLPTTAITITSNSNAFTGIAQVVSVNGSAGNTPLPANMFYGNTNMTAITIGSYITSIGASAFQGCTSLPSITIPTSVTSIGASAFQGCTLLPSITIPDSVTSIGNSAFQGCTSLPSITIPASVTSIGESPFQGCSLLTSINVAADNTVYTNYNNDGNIYNRPITTFIQYAIGKTATSFTIPTSVNTIRASAFQGCTNMTTITINSNVTSIETSAFQGCSALTKVYVQSNTLVSMGTTVFTGIPSNSTLFTTSVNLNNTSLTQYFTNTYLIQLTNYLVKNPNTGEKQDLFYLFYPGNSGIITGYKTPTRYDLGSTFASLNGGTQLPFVTNYKKNGADFNTLFSTTLPQFIISNNNTFTSTNFVKTNSYNAVIFEYTGGVYAWNGVEPTPGKCDITFNTSVNLNYLIIGGGGGGGRGNSTTTTESPGSGGSGGGIIYNNTTPLTIPANTTFNIQVGFNGGGNSNDSSSVIYSGKTGGTSYIKSTQYDISFNAFGGEPGGGTDIPENSQSGNGGNATIYSTLSPGSYDNFGGGGGGGGGVTSNIANKQGGSYNAGYGGYLNTTFNQGQNGSNGSKPTPPRTYGTGRGGSSYYLQNITVPFSNVNSSGNTSSYVYAGNGGGGGSGTNGGYAGDISGGGSYYVNDYCQGQNATSGFNNNNFYYGSGGGGSATRNSNPALLKGGNGGKGVVMLWWSV